MKGRSGLGMNMLDHERSGRRLICKRLHDSGEVGVVVKPSSCDGQKGKSPVDETTT
jgi:hypothetical protein